jgi:HJR/Mrr/RecB family endonuclease
LSRVVRDAAVVTYVQRAAEVAAGIANRDDLTGLILDTYDADGRSLLPAIEFAKATRPDLPLVLYTPLTPNAIRAVVSAAKLGVEHVVLHRFDDEPKRFRELLEQEGFLAAQAPGLVVPERIVLVGTAVSQELIGRLASNPRDLYSLTPRQFEELVAELLARQGFDVHTTARTRDGGKDIVVSSRNPLGEQVYYVECKRYGPDNPVGVALVRELYGVVQSDRVTGGMLATTSYFTRDALGFQSSVPHQLALKDHADLKRWLEKATLS